MRKILGTFFGTSMIGVAHYSYIRTVLSNIESCYVRDITLDNNVVLLFKDFKTESLPWSKLFKADNSKILDCMNGPKIQFFKKNDCLSKFGGWTLGNNVTL